ncbi:hypothetical protein [Streptomyces sp. BBFR102]|uniref:TetR/AcrR family transcriptional regulator n=1 Tax=Streptomyces sp. BBFR102 TaxID=3448171 RepID=UPI003F53B269
MSARNSPPAATASRDPSPLRHAQPAGTRRRPGRRPDPRLRAGPAASPLIGVAMLGCVREREPLASADGETVVATVGPMLQRYLTGPEAVPAAGV